MKTLLPLLTLCLICISNFSIGQSLPNGDFEFHELTECSYNFTNENFNLQIENINAYGLANEIDLQNSSCAYGDPESGDWFISIATSQQLETDEFSLNISPPLEAGSTYTFTYYEKADTSFGGIDSLMIGLSMTNESFGTSIETILPTAMEWNARTFTIVAPFAAEYLTFKNQINLRTWTFLDGVQIVSTSNTSSNDEYAVNVYPNPAQDVLTIQSAPNSEINIFDLNGRMIFRQAQNNLTSHEIDISALRSGLYLVKIRNSRGSENFKIQKL